MKELWSPSTSKGRGLVNLNILLTPKNRAELALGMGEEKGSVCRPEYNQHIQ